MIRRVSQSRGNAVQPANKRQIKLEMPVNPSATYANTVMISHNPNEVYFDFIQVVPHDTRARVQQRIVMSPVHAKLFLNALIENIGRYETAQGEIKLPAAPESLAEMLFKSANPPTPETPASDEGSPHE
jgi:hypothetical protein